MKKIKPRQVLMMTGIISSILFVVFLIWYMIDYSLLINRLLLIDMSILILTLLVIKPKKI